MRKFLYPVVVAGLAGMLAVGIASCSYSSTTTTETSVTTETTNEDGTTETTTTTTSTSEGTDGSSSDTTTTKQVTVDMNSWESGWAGTGSEGDNVFYAESPDGTQALIVVYTPSTDTLIHVVGPVVNNDGQLTITDVGDGSTFTFTIGEQNGDGVADLALGDEFGTVTLNNIALEDMVEQIQAVDKNGEVFA